MVRREVSGLIGDVILGIAAILVYLFFLSSEERGSGASRASSRHARRRILPFVVGIVYAAPAIPVILRVIEHHALFKRIPASNLWGASLAVLCGLAVGTAVARRAGERLPAFVAAAAVASLILMTTISLTQVFSVDGCVSQQWQGEQDEAQDPKQARADTSGTRRGLFGGRQANGDKVDARSRDKAEVPPIDCGALSSSSELRVAVVTMRLTLFGVLGTFLFGLVAVFALLLGRSGDARDGSADRQRRPDSGDGES